VTTASQRHACAVVRPGQDGSGTYFVCVLFRFSLITMRGWMGTEAVHSLEGTSGRGYWLWVTRPLYYLEEDGTDRKSLDPSSRLAAGDWWTCHKDTRRGDLVFLWRTSPRRDIGYLIQAATDAYSLSDHEYARDRGWQYGCDYAPLWRFRNPVTLEDLRNSPYSQDWGAYRARFQGKVFRIPVQQWRRLSEMLSHKNPGFGSFIQRVQTQVVDQRILLEEEVEEAIAKDLGRFRRFGYDLQLYHDPARGITGRQVTCTGTDRGRIARRRHSHKRWIRREV
jgi:hypothetical protein